MVRQAGPCISLYLKEFRSVESLHGDILRVIFHRMRHAMAVH